MDLPPGNPPGPLELRLGVEGALVADDLDLVREVEALVDPVDLQPEVLRVAVGDPRDGDGVGLRCGLRLGLGLRGGGICRARLRRRVGAGHVGGRGERLGAGGVVVGVALLQLRGHLLLGVLRGLRLGGVLLGLGLARSAASAVADGDGVPHLVDVPELVGGAFGERETSLHAPRIGTPQGQFGPATGERLAGQSERRKIVDYAL